MKKILVNLIVFALILGISTSAYAFNVSVDADVNEVKTNNQVTLEVNYEENVITTDFVVKYDTSKFKFIRVDTKNTEVNNIEASGELVVCFYDMNKVGTDTIKLVFESKTVEGVGKFELSDVTGHTDKEEVSKVGSTSIKNVSINNGEDNVEDKETITNTSGSRLEVDDTVSTSRLPNTGATLPIILGVILLLVAILVIKYNKNISQIKDKSKGIFSIVIVLGIVLIANSTLALNLTVKVDESKKVVTVESFIGSILDKDSLEEALNETITDDIATGLNVKEDYSLVIYGDINKDGKINSSDIYEIINSDEKELDDLQKMAANVHSNDEINEDDVKLIEKYILRLNDLTVTSNEENTESEETEEDESTEETPSEGTENTEEPKDDEVTEETPSEGTEETPSEGTEDTEEPKDDEVTEETPSEGTEDTEEPKDDEVTEETPNEGTEDTEEPKDDEVTEETPSEGTEDTEEPKDDEVTEETPSEGTEDTEESKEDEEQTEERTPICRDIIDQVIYSNTNLTWESVLVTVTAKEELGETEGWTVSEDKMTAWKEYTKNTVEKVKIYAANGDYEEIKVTILNIWDLGLEDDIEDLTASVTVRNKDGKYGDTYYGVIVTITTNNPITCPNGWTMVSPDGTKIQKEYDENTEEIVKLTDQYGSKLTLNISVDNILIAVEDVTLSTNLNTNENGEYIVDLNSDEIKENFGFSVTAKVTPANASNPNLNWTVTDEEGNAIDYATITNGKLKFATETVTEVYDGVSYQREVLSDKVALGNRFVVTAKTKDISEIEKSITFTIEESPTVIDLGMDDIYLFMNGDETLLVGTTDRDIYNEDGDYVETVTEDVYQKPSVTLNATTYPQTSTINTDITYRIVKYVTDVGYTEDTTGYASIEGNIITGLKNTEDATVYVEATAGINGAVVDRAELHVYTAPEAITLTNEDEEEITEVTLSTNLTKTATIYANLLPDTVSTDFNTSQITWTIDNANVATLPETVEGNSVKITAAGVGTATLTATTINGHSASVKINVGVELEKITLTPETITLECNGTDVFEEQRLTVEFVPEDYTGDRTITWSSSNTAQVTVDQTGIIKAVSYTDKGSPVTVTATLDADTTKTATSKVSVANVPKTLDLTIDSTTLYINSDTETATLTATIDSDATTIASQPIYWSTSDQSIVKISKTQTTVAEDATTTSITLTAVRNGTATITAKTAGTNSITKTIDITVGTDPSKIIPTFTNITIVKGNTGTIGKIIAPFDANNNTEVVVSMPDEEAAVASVNGDTITATAAGETTVTLETANGKTATINVTVIDEIAANALYFKKTGLTALAGKTVKTALRIGSDIQNEDGTKTAKYESSNEEIATVDDEGVITTIKAGSATIKATVGDKTASLKITVLDFSNNAAIANNGTNKKTLILNNSNSNTATLEVTTDNSASVKWYTQNSSIVTVNEDGKITAKGAGTCNVYAVPPGDTPTVVTFEVTVKVAPTSIKLAAVDGDKTVTAGATKDIKVTYSPTTVNADKGITWEYNTAVISNIVAAGGDVYTVTASDTITANTKVTITGTSANGKTATITLTVTPVVEEGVETASFLLGTRFADSDFVTSMLDKVKSNSEKSINYVEIENSKVFDITENGNYYAIVNENSETKLVKIVDGLKLEKAIAINATEIVDIEVINENTVNVVAKTNNILEVLKIDFDNVQVLENYKIYTENEENVENSLVNINEKENKFAILTSNESVEIKVYNLSDVKNEELANVKTTNSLNIAKGNDDSSFNRYEVKAFSVNDNTVYFVEGEEEAYLTIFTLDGNIEVLSRKLDKANVENIKVTDEEIFVGI